MGFLSKEEALARLTDERNLANKFGAGFSDFHSDANDESVEDTPHSTSDAEEPAPVVLHKTPGWRDQGRRKGDRNLLPFERVLVGLAARTSTAREAAEAFEVSPGHAHQLKHGRIGQGNPNEDLKKAIDDGSQKISDVVVEKLLRTMGALTDDKINKLVSAKDVVQVGRELATIHDKLQPKDKGGSHVGAQVVIMAPQQKSLQEFQVIELPAATDVD